MDRTRKVATRPLARRDVLTPVAARARTPAAATTTVTISHPAKLLFPEDHISKGDVAAYYADVASLMLPHVAARPLTLERYPSGIGAPGFIQKNIPRGAPPWLTRAEVPKSDGTVTHAVLNDARSLQWMANQNTITPHVWPSRLPRLYQPDICVFDLDPSADDIGRVRWAALLVRDTLHELGLRSWVKTSGSKGFHIVVPLAPEADFGAVARFAHRVGANLVARYPEQLTQEFSKADRGDRIYVDTGRNGYSATFAAVYALRPRRGAPVSAPCLWEEIEDGSIGPQSVTLRTLPARLAAHGDLWADLLKLPQSLPPPPAEL